MNETKEDQLKWRKTFEVGIRARKLEKRIHFINHNYSFFGEELLMDSNAIVELRVLTVDVQY